jgi:iron complex outermembrane receptor protein
LFGRNTSAGSVNLYVRKPADTFSGNVVGGIGSYGYRELRGNVNVPISSAIRTKLSAYRIYSDGYVNNVTTGEKLNGDDSWGVRGAVSIDFAPNVTWDTSLSYISDKALNILNTPCSRLDANNCNGRFAATGIANPLRTTTGRFNTNVPVSGEKGGFGLGNNVENLLAISDLKIDLGGAKINLITGYIDTRQHYAIDFFDGRSNAPGYTFVGSPPLPTFSANQVNPPISGNPNGNFALTNVGRFKQFSQEVKIAGSAFGDAVDYVGGLFYFQERNRTDYADIFGTFLLADRVLNNDVTSYAAYGQADWHIIPSLTATVGLRYTHEEKTIDFFDNRPQCAANQATAGCISTANFLTTTFPSGATIPLKQTTSRVTPRFALTYKPSEEFLVFASATNGFRSGGWNARSSAVTTILPFGPETTWSYELGAKTEWLDGKLRINATAFYTRISDLQVLSSFINPTSGALSFISGNYADQDNKGLELEFQAVPVRNLTLFANVGLQDANYIIDRSAPTRTNYNVLSVNAQQQECRAALAGATSPLVGDARAAASRAQSFCGAGIVTPNGDISRVVRAPDVTISGGISYKIEAGAAGNFTPNVAVSYFSDSETGSSNVNIYQDPGGAYNLQSGNLVFGSHNKPTALVNASLGWQSANKMFGVTIACQNCFDVVYVQSALSNFSYINPPRNWTATLRVDF